MKRFLRIYAEVFATMLAITVPIGSAIAPIILYLVYDNPWWFLLYIVIVPLIAAVLEYVEG